MTLFESNSNHQILDLIISSSRLFYKNHDDRIRINYIYIYIWEDFEKYSEIFGGYNANVSDCVLG